MTEPIPLFQQAKAMFEPQCEQPCRQYVIIAMLWLLWFAVFSMNYIAYFHDYSRYSDEVFIMGITYKNFSLMAGMITVILDIVTLWGLFGSTPFLERLPFALRIAIVTAITVLGLTVVIYTHTVTTPQDLKNKDTTDPLLSRKHHRVILYSFILLIDLVMVILQFSYDRHEIGFHFSGDMFGGMGGCEQSGTTFGNFFGLLFGLGGVAADALALRTQIKYNPEDYGLPANFD